MTEAVIGRFVLEVSARTDAAAAEAEAGMLNGLGHDRLTLLLEECLAEFPEHARDVWADRLEVDLGTLPPSLSGDRLYAIAKAAVKERLLSLLSDAPEADGASPPHLSAASLARSHEELESTTPIAALAAFLTHGTLHWSRSPATTIEALVGEALEQDPETLRTLTRAAMADPAKAQRLADHLPTAQIARLSQVMAPQAGELLASLHQLFIGLHQSLPIADRSTADILAAANRAVLEAGARLGSVWISEARVGEEFFHSLAGQLRLDVGGLTAGLAARARDRRHPAIAAGRGAELLIRLAGAGAMARPPPAAGNRMAPFANDVEAMEAAEAFLRTGIPPVRAGQRNGERVSEQALRLALTHWLTAGERASKEWRTLRQAFGAGRVTGRDQVLARLRLLLSGPDAEAALRQLHLTDGGAASVRPEGAGSPALRRLAHSQTVLADHQDQGSEDDVAVPGRREIALFWFLVEYGALPWWGRELRLGSVDDWVRNLTTERGAEVAASLRMMPEPRRALLIERLAARIAPAPLAAIAAAADPELQGDVGDWLAMAPEIAARLAAAGGGGTGNVPPTAGRVLQAMMAALLGRLFDPHAPRLTWSALRQTLEATVARRLGLLPDQVVEAIPGASADGPASDALAASQLPVAADGLPDSAVGAIDQSGDRGRSSERHEQGTENSADDITTIQRFISPVYQLTVGLEDVAAIMRSTTRQRQAISPLSPAEFDILAARLAPGEPTMRLAALAPLGEAIHAVLPALEPAQWRRDLADAIAAALAEILGGGQGRPVSALGVLERLLRRHAIRYGCVFSDYVAAVGLAALTAGSAESTVMALLQLLGSEAAATPTSAGALPPPDAGESEPTSTATASQEARRFGLPAAGRLDELELLAGFLAMPDGAPGRQRMEAAVRRALAEPVRRAVIAARMTTTELDRLAAKLGVQDQTLVPGEIRGLHRLLADLVPGVGTGTWVHDTVARVMADWSVARPETGPRYISQLRQLLIRFARDEALAYAPAARQLALLSRKNTGALTQRVREALTILAASAEADAPIPDAEPREPTSSSGLPGEREALSRRAPADAVRLATDGAGKTPEQSFKRGESSEEPHGSAADEDTPHEQPPSGSVAEGNRLIEAALTGDREAGYRLRVWLVEPTRRQRLGGSIGAETLDCLVVALELWDGAVRPSDLLQLGPLVSGLATGSAAANWRALIANEILVLLAERPVASSRRLNHHHVLRRALQVATGSGAAAAILAGDILSAAQGSALRVTGPLSVALGAIAQEGREVVAQQAPPQDEQRPIDREVDETVSERPPDPSLKMEAIGTAALTEAMLAIGPEHRSFRTLASHLAQRLMAAEARRELEASLPQSTLTRVGKTLERAGFGLNPVVAVALSGRAAAPGDGDTDWQPDDWRSLPDLIATLISTPSASPHFTELAETVWRGLLDQSGKEIARATLPLDVLREVVALLRVSGFAFDDTVLTRTPDQGSEPRTNAQILPLPALAETLFAEAPPASVSADVARMWRALQSRAGRAVLASALPPVRREQLPGLLAQHGYELGTDARAGLGLGFGELNHAAPALIPAPRTSGPGGRGAEPNDQTEAAADEEPNAPAAGERATPAVPKPEAWEWQVPDEPLDAWLRELIFVGDAGVVLLWPFLAHYFDRVGLLQDGRFASEAAAARGVMLIHYMATANTETEEPQLVLPKLLCGVPFATPVSPRIALTEMEDIVSEELLNVVCQNWPPLRNSSVEALRETFLLREGSLSWLEERIWVLKVTAKPFDMLLGQLPWTISTFKTPLMTHPMMVQWGQQ